MGGLIDALQVRPATPDELDLVLASWSESYKFSPWAGNTPNHRFFDINKEVVGGLIARGATLVVACEPQTQRVFGWGCYERKGEDGVVHYVYVKSAWRRQGIGARLFTLGEGKRTFVTHMTKAASRVCRERGYIFAPEIARRKAL